MGEVLPRPRRRWQWRFRTKMAVAAELGALGRRWFCWLLGLQAVRTGSGAFHSRDSVRLQFQGDERV